MGAVIGRNREHLNEIEQKTGATLKVFRKGSNSSLFIKGFVESQKRAIRKIKEQVVSLAMKVTLKQLITMQVLHYIWFIFCNENQRAIH